ncbi:uncharacterized protein [Acropora muricata]|uniref:uncharacterized protein isoform X3 n=1 Tax=Acropora muricata TaxID=159855 RepID=UPI0034E45AB0
METTERRRGAKYMEGYLEIKESAKWIIYWVVVRGPQLFFFKDSDTQNKENIRGHVNIGPSSSFSSGKKSKGKFEFEIKAEKGKKYLLRVGTESLRVQWINSLELAAQGKPSPERFAPLQETVEEEKTSNQYTEVPNPTCSTSSDICEVIQEDMNKMFSRKHNSFGDHCKRLLRTKSKSFCQEQESREPVSEGTDAKSEPFYDIVPHQNPPWYFGKLSREQSEEILQNYEPGRYLVRDSESVHKPGAYTLSLKHRDRCRHHKIETLPDGNLVIKQHEDKPFPNLVMLMAYFVKSQERDIRLEPVICEKREGNAESENGSADPKESYEIIDQRPAPIGREEREYAESPNAVPSQRSHGYQNHPDRQTAQRPSLRRHATESVISTYQNVPPPKREPNVASRTSPSPYQQESYEVMTPKDDYVEPLPALPPRKKSVADEFRHGYENIPDKRPPPRTPAGDSYENVPPIPGTSPSDRPQLPPRAPKQNLLGYENLPSSARSSPRLSSYQNDPHHATGSGRHSTGTMQGSRREPHAQLKRASTLPPHIIQNTLGQMSINEEP